MTRLLVHLPLNLNSTGIQTLYYHSVSESLSTLQKNLLKIMSFLINTLMSNKRTMNSYSIQFGDKIPSTENWLIKIHSFVRTLDITTIFCNHPHQEIQSSRRVSQPNTDRLKKWCWWKILTTPNTESLHMSTDSLSKSTSSQESQCSRKSISGPKNPISLLHFLLDLQWFPTLLLNSFTSVVFLRQCRAKGQRLNF